MTCASDRLRVLVLGYLVRAPLGGIAWHYLQYVLGLAELGHDVYFFEDSDDYPSCYDPVRNVTDTDPAYGLAFADRVFERLGMGARWAYFDAHRDRWSGLASRNALELCATADVILNVSGVNPIRAWMDAVPVRVLVDTDPGFTQVRHLTDPAARKRAAEHTAFFSFGENIGQAQCMVPNDGFRWWPTRQPVAMDVWAPTRGRIDDAWSTVMQWDSYRSVEHDRTRYGMKGESFGPYLNLPRRCSDTFVLALGSRSDVRQQLAEHGWRTVDSREPTADPWTFQRFIQRSKGEFSVAKHGYVVSRSGWFSERSAAYLASGRPVVVQDTGFTSWLRADEGVLAFATADDALTQIEALNRDYERHCIRAREVAAEYFRSTQVLRGLLDRVLNS